MAEIGSQTQFIIRRADLLWQDSDCADIPPLATGGEDEDKEAADTLYEYLNCQDLEEYTRSFCDTDARQQKRAYLKRAMESGVPLGEEVRELVESTESFLNVRVSYY